MSVIFPLPNLLWTKRKGHKSGTLGDLRHPISLGLIFPNQRFPDFLDDKTLLSSVENTDSRLLF